MFLLDLVTYLRLPDRCRGQARALAAEENGAPEHNTQPWDQAFPPSLLWQTSAQEPRPGLLMGKRTSIPAGPWAGLPSDCDEPQPPSCSASLINGTSNSAPRAGEDETSPGGHGSSASSPSVVRDDEQTIEIALKSYNHGKRDRAPPVT